jgi:hypothetical protein
VAELGLARTVSRQASFILTRGANGRGRVAVGKDPRSTDLPRFIEA